nr:hypothetical protein [Mycobacterium sp. D16R24]
MLLATDQRIVSVQVIDGSGQVVRRPESASQIPLIPLHDSTSSDARVGVSATPCWRGGGIEPIESMVSTVATMLVPSPHQSLR